MFLHIHVSSLCDSSLPTAFAAEDDWELTWNACSGWIFTQPQADRKMQGIEEKLIGTYIDDNG